MTGRLTISSTVVANRSPDRAEVMLRQLVQYGADEAKLRAAFARQPASLDLDTRLQRAWSEAIGITAPPSAAVDAPPVRSPVPLGPETFCRPEPATSRYSLRDWIVGWLVVILVAVTLAGVVVYWYN